MNKQKNSSSFKSPTIIGIIFLVTGILQAIIAILVVAIEYSVQPEFLKSDAFLLTSLIVPEAFLLVYFAVRLYAEMHSAWRAALAITGYIPIALFSISLPFAFAPVSIVKTVFFALIVLLLVLVPINLVILGIKDTKTWMSLVAIMLLNIDYCSLSAFAGHLDLCVIFGLGFIIPLMLLVAIDLAVQRRATNINKLDGDH